MDDNDGLYLLFFCVSFFPRFLASPQAFLAFLSRGFLIISGPFSGEKGSFEVPRQLLVFFFRANEIMSQFVENFMYKKQYPYIG